jgi:TM2 domain-containing membrane protein YozV
MNTVAQAWFAANSDKFNAADVPAIKSALEKMDDGKAAALAGLQLKNPTTGLLIALFLGGWGIQRFMINQTGRGVLMLLTAGGCGVLTIIDWFTIMGAFRAFNYEQFKAIA